MPSENNMWITAAGRLVHVQLSDRPGDYLSIGIDQERRELLVYDVNGAVYRNIPCPAVAAGVAPRRDSDLVKWLRGWAQYAEDVRATIGDDRIAAPWTPERWTKACEQLRLAADRLEKLSQDETAIGVSETTDVT